VAETVKRRVAAARLAVAFVAAGTIAGAAWAQAGPPPITAESSAADISAKLGEIKGEFVDSKNVVNGSLLFKDFHKGQIPSLEQFQKLKLATERYQKAADGRFAETSDLATVKGDVDAVKGVLGSYVKSTEADARYLKASESVVRGNGSVFSGSRPIPPFGGKRASVMEVPGLLAIEAENWKPRLFYVVNQTGGALTHTGCGGGGGTFGASPGVIPPGKSFHCPVLEEPVTIQLVGEGPNPTIVTLTVSAVAVGQPQEGQVQEAQYTAQILVGM
jgi:hypothetical protein